MTLFTNPNFIDHIVKSQSAEAQIPQDQYALLQTLIELETRLLVQTAIKFMQKDRRDTLITQDILIAAKENSHTQMVIPQHTSQYQQQNQQIFKVDKIYPSPQAIFEEQMKFLGNIILDEPKMKGQWIYIKGKVPATIDNSNLKTLAQLTSAREHEAQQKRKLFNVIKDEGISMLTKQQTQYFKKMALIIYSDIIPKGGFIVDGNMGRLLPYFLNFICYQINDTGITFLLKALESKFIVGCLEYNLRRLLNILLSYKGSLSFIVGQKIAWLVQQFIDKYPILLHIYDGYDQQSYSTILKKIAFQLRLGVIFEVNQKLLIKCKQDSQANDPIAIIFMRTLLNYAGKLEQFRELLENRNGMIPFWHPCAELKNDPYLGGL